MSNVNLQAAKEDKNDEFYTFYEDIAAELQYYSALLKGKSIYCLADNPEISDFWKYFKDNYKTFGLLELYSTFFGEGAKCTYCDGGEESSYELSGDGDFRSQECLDILDKVDVVITNPPFSLFRELFSILVERNKDFILLGTLNSVTYKEIFPFLKERKVRLGVHSGSFKFLCPSRIRDNVKLVDNQWIASFGNICWFTTLDHGQLQPPIVLEKEYVADRYPKYDNFDARDVGKVTDIPKDYEGPLGVPATIFQKWCPDQFIILGNLGSYGVDGYSLANAIYIDGRKVFKRILIRRTKEEDFVYRPSKYEVSQKSLERFAAVFNRTFPSFNQRMLCHNRETFDNDGYIMVGDTRIGFDWEIRDRHFTKGIFQFNTFGQFERKLIKPSVQLSLQCDPEEEFVIAAWHQDFLGAEQITVPCLTDTGKQQCPVRYTRHFRIYSYQKLWLLKKDIQSVVSENLYSFSRRECS